MSTREPARAHSRVFTGVWDTGTVGDDREFAADADALEVRVLGPIQVLRHGTAIDLGGARPRLALAILVAAAGRVVTLEDLIDGLYGEDPPPTARKSAQVHVSNLRRRMGDAHAITTVGGGYAVETRRVEIDALRFAAEHERLARLIEDDPVVASATLSASLARWEGRPYADLADEPALAGEITRLTELRLRAVEQKIDIDLRLGRHADVIGELESLTVDHPFRESFRAQLMVALYRSGRQADALRAFARMRSSLIEELGIEPSEPLRALERQILTQSSALDLGLRSSRVASSPTAVRGYELRTRLGRTVTGELHLAYQPSVGRPAVIDLIPADTANRPDFVKRFDTELDTIARLDHPHIAPIDDHWRDPDGAYVVFHVASDVRLVSDRLRTIWNPPRVLQLVDQIGSALSHAHRAGVVHGAVGPSSVLVGEDGDAYLIGFGPGTKPADADVRTDVYGLASTAYELLAGENPTELPPRSLADIDPTLPVELDGLFADALSPDPAKRPPRVDDLRRSLRRAFGADVTLRDDTNRADGDVRPVRNPFKGLRAFTEADAADFYGRTQLVDDIIASVRANGLTVVVGPSGSGKSSAVRAGVLPLVRAGAIDDRHDWVIAEMFPGSYPFEELEAGLRAISVGRVDGLSAELTWGERGLLTVAERILPDEETELLLLIDQFEELFTQVHDEAMRARFLANLVNIAADPGGRVKVVATMRADFFDRPLHDPDFAAALERGMVTVAMPSDDELALAINGPSTSAGLDVEPELVPTILRDLAREPGSLPLLQYALTELVDRSDDARLTVDRYLAGGGAVGALARRAEQIYAELAPGARDAARQMFLRLVTVADDNEVARRRVRRTDLWTLRVGRAALDNAIEQYGSFRLLSFDRDPVTRGPTVEVAHEALISRWPRYRSWVDHAREDLLVGRRLDATAREWDDADRDPGFLLRDKQYELFAEWADRTDIRLTALERDFLAESGALVESEVRARQDSARRDISLRRRSKYLLASAAAAIVLLMVAVVALVGRNNAQADRQQALERDRLQLEISALAGDALDALDDDPTLTASLAIEAIRASPPLGGADPGAVDALHFALQDAHLVFPADEETPVAVRPSPDGPRGVFLLPLDDLVQLAQPAVARRLTPNECDTYFPQRPCPDPTASLAESIEVVGGLTTYREEYTDPERPLRGTSVTMAGWEDQIAAQMLVNGAYQVEPDIEIAYRQVDVGDPDLFEQHPDLDLVFATEPAWTGWAAAQHELVDLTSIIGQAELDRRLGPRTARVAQFQIDGEPATFGVPTMYVLRSVVFYSRPYFDLHGYDEPRTWDELIQLSDRMVYDGNTPWCWGAQPSGFSMSSPVADWLGTLLLSEFGMATHDAWANGDLPFASDPIRASFDRLATLTRSPGYVAELAPSIAETTTWDAAVSLDKQHPSCMMAMFPSFAIELLFHHGDLGWFPFPAIDPANDGWLMVDGNVTSMTVDSPETRAVLNAQLARESINWALTERGGFIPTDVDYDVDAGFEDVGVNIADSRSELQRELIEATFDAVREDRVVWNASGIMPYSVGRTALEQIPTRWWSEGPHTRDDILAELDAARAAAGR